MVFANPGTHVCVHVYCIHMNTRFQASSSRGMFYEINHYTCRWSMNPLSQQCNGTAPCWTDDALIIRDALTDDAVDDTTPCWYYTCWYMIQYMLMLPLHGNISKHVLSRECFISHELSLQFRSASTPQWQLFSSLMMLNVTKIKQK